MTRISTKRLIPFLIAMLSIGCSQDYEVKGVIYSGTVNLNRRIRQFTATSQDNKKDIILNMTGPQELTVYFNNKISHIDYEKAVIIFRSETEKSEWTVKKVRDGFELEDGTLLQYGDCRGWAICLLDDSTRLPILKGNYSLRRSRTIITLWISESEKHLELLGLMANGLLNRSRNAKEMNESLETILPQVWAY